MPFQDSLDLANFACQMLGTEPIASVTEDSVKNRELSFAYDKLRQTELLIARWRFAIRKAVLRAVDPGTMILVPDQWLSTTTYLPGSIVADTNNFIWISKVDQNLDNKPGGFDRDLDDEIPFHFNELALAWDTV